MRTLKKSLCLVLALVFVLGLCTFGTNAAYAGYSDIAKVTEEYMDAVEVLSGLDVIEGYPDGSFNPGANVTRAEAAAMIARMMLNREGADKLPVGDVKFSDVPETNWAAKYIAFCANKGIIVGMGDGTFRPNDNITGTQMATMLLRALGYGVIGEYEGKGWDINAVADALYYGVFEDSLVTDFNQPATREETALYIWNTMWIQLVGYDVDLNYYDGKVERIGWNEYVPLYFAREAFYLEEKNYEDTLDKDGNYKPLIVLATKETGSKYTVVGEYDSANKEFDIKYRLDYEVSKDMVGHEVTAYIDIREQEDTKEHVKYFNCYLIKDESEVLENGEKLDDFYRNAKAANVDNLNKYLRDIPSVTNFDFFDGFGPGSFINAWGDYASFSFLWDVKDGDKDAEGNPVIYDYVKDMKGQKSSSDSAPRGTWVLDHEGKFLLVLKDTYYIGQVQNVDSDHDEVEIKYYKNGVYETEIFDMAWKDVELIYNGIAEDDYVVVRPIGSLVYIEATTTEDVDITQRDLFIMWYYFNGFTVAPDLTVVSTFEVEGQENPGDVNPGDKVRFYKTSAGYFSVVVLERAKTEGVVYVTSIDKYLDHSEWDKDGAYSYAWKVQGINQDGDEVVYKYSETAWDKLADNLKPVVGSVFEVRKTGSSYVFDPDVRNLVKLTNDGGKTSFLKSTSDTYYVQSDTKVIYFDQSVEPKKLASTIEIANKLSDKKTGYLVYAIAKKSGGSYKLETCWVPEGVEAPDTYDVDSIIYVGGVGRYKATANYKLYNEENTPYYSVFKDGVYTSNLFLTGEAEIYSTGDTIKSDFYYYTDSDEDGILELTPAKKVNKGVVLGKDADGMVEDGRLFVELVGGKTEDVTLKNDIIDVSGGTTTYTKSDTAINSVSRLEKLLKEGYKVTIDYMYTVSDGEQIPVGTIYVTHVDASGAKK